MFHINLIDPRLPRLLWDDMFHSSLDAVPAGQAVQGQTFGGEDESFPGGVQFDCQGSFPVSVFRNLDISREKLGLTLNSFVIFPGGRDLDTDLEPVIGLARESKVSATESPSTHRCSTHP